MKRDFLEGLGLEKEAIDKIMAENGSDLEKEKAKTTAAKADLADVRGELATTKQELETAKASSGDAADIQKKLDELQAKYDTDIADRDAKLADRDYSDAVTAFIAEKGLKFSSKGAERYFRAAFKEKIERKDGAFVGADDFLKSQQESDPDAFAKEGGVRVDLGGSLGGGTPETGPTTLAGALRERYEQQKG